MLFGPGLQTALLGPFRVAGICLAVLFSGVLPDRSPQIAALGLFVGLCGLVELIAVPTAFFRLARTPELRTARNVAFSVAGLSLFLIVVWVWLVALYA